MHKLHLHRDFTSSLSYAAYEPVRYARSPTVELRMVTACDLCIPRVMVEMYGEPHEHCNESWNAGYYDIFPNPFCSHRVNCYQQQNNAGLLQDWKNLSCTGADTCGTRLVPQFGAECCDEDKQDHWNDEYSDISSVDQK
ncbi:Os01g0345401 [Oryza sativa Japonica Group]|uniref:Os01g0345401 protein n=1 Tax=Oryza sativa subsp. japonica TaxID=39947 RepID=A0A0P0V255_ORYSJ|nr:Os01g0345401 [Oryza sativa Japonica Group]